MLPPRACALITKQDGVVSRSQLFGLGVDDNAIEVAVRRRELTRIGRGVYVDHTGDPAWEQNVWAACLRYAPAVADPATTLALNGIGDKPVRIGVAVDWKRYVGGEKRIRVLRTRSFDDQAQLDLNPPRLRLEHAAIEHASSLVDEQAMVGVLADVVGGAADFRTVLVYDVSRWGRYQNPDQAGHYEFLCADAGVPVEYCAESFVNDHSLGSVIQKALKEANKIGVGQFILRGHSNIVAIKPFEKGLLLEVLRHANEVKAAKVFDEIPSVKVDKEALELAVINGVVAAGLGAIFDDPFPDADANVLPLHRSDVVPEAVVELHAGW